MGVKQYNLTSGQKCPALIFEEGRYWCADYTFEKWRVVFGFGCSSSLNTWRREVKERG